MVSRKNIENCKEKCAPFSFEEIWPAIISDGQNYERYQSDISDVTDKQIMYYLIQDGCR